MTTKKAPTSEQTDHTEIPTINEESTGMGEIKINNNVVANIVRFATLEVEGTHSVANSGFEGINELFKRRDSIVVTEDEAKNYLIEIHVVLRFGVQLAKVAEDIQRNVKTQVTRMTNNEVAQVNVIIERVEMENGPTEPNDEYEPTAD